MPVYRTIALLLAIKVQAGPSYYLPYDFSLSFPYILAPRTIPIISPFFTPGPGTPPLLQY